MAENLAAIVYSRIIIRSSSTIQLLVTRSPFMSNSELVPIHVADLNLMQKGAGGGGEARKAGKVEEPES